MKFKSCTRIPAILCLLLVGPPSVFAQGTAFLYQGRLADGTNAANGRYDLQFDLRDALINGNSAGPTNTLKAVGVTNGVFALNLDFGAAGFTGPDRWLEIAVRTNGSSSAFTLLIPRQAITPTPMAIFAGKAATATTAGSVSANTITAAAIQNGVITAAKLAPGQVVKSLNGLTDTVTLSAGANVTLTTNGNNLQVAAVGGAFSGWALSGNAGTSGANFLGTSDNSALELRVFGQRGLRLEPGNFGEVNVIGGAANNSVGSLSVGAFIGGGYANAIGYNASNSTIGGGAYNTNSGGTIGGGIYNSTTQNAVIGGGSFNTASGQEATVAGGYNNSASGNFASVPGGIGSYASGIGSFAAGYNNGATGNYATIPGGSNNYAFGTGSFAAGVNARVLYNGSFIWGDGTQRADSTGSNRFEVLATGGINLYTGGNNVSIAAPAALAFGGTTRQMLNLYGSGYGIGVQNYTLYSRSGSGFAWYAGGSHNDNQNNAGGGSTLMLLDGGGNLNVTANASVCSLTIRGGCDVAEPFQISNQEIPKGSVVVIDEENPGRLKLSDRAYDSRVAGIVSGANGINPGISLSQQGVLEGGQDVALSGRVYVLADAANGPIKPGDMLTTSATPGHAMKVTNHQHAQGAILGKAMSALDQGQGMVLVLVTLQ